MVPLCDVLREKTEHSLLFQELPWENASEIFGSSFYLIKTERRIRDFDATKKRKEVLTLERVWFLKLVLVTHLTLERVSLVFELQRSI